MRNPWQYREYGEIVATVDAPGRLDIVKRCTSIEQLQTYAAWDGTQKSVRLAAERRIRKLQKEGRIR